MTTLRSHGWRLLLLASGALMLAGGPRHPEADARDPLRQELATMTAHPDWVPAHTLILASTVVLALGLWAARASRTWPAATGRALTVGAAAVSVYALEAAFHLAAVVDSDALAHGHAAPVATTHIGLSIVLYPVTGAAIAWLALTAGRAMGGWRVAIAPLGVLAGLAQAASVPLSLLLPDLELSPLFAGAALLTAAWSIATGAAGVGPRARPATAVSAALVSADHADRVPV